MRLLVVNPNTTRSMTEKIGAAARAVALPDTEIIAVSPEAGPPSIEGYYDEAFAVPGLIAEMQKAGTVDATIIACFDDTGLDAARSFSPAPVIGIGEAAFHLASLIAGKFVAVTTLSRSVPAIEHNLVRYGLSSRCARVRAADVAVLELEVPGSAARARISREIDRAIHEDNADAIVLGCAGMTDLADALSREHGLPVVDGVAAAVKLAESLHRLGLKTSKRHGYASPIRKPYVGTMSRFSPTGE
jgi:allantoin racemase